MADIATLFSYIIQLFQLEFTLYGFTFSLWEVFVFSLIAGLIAWLLGEVFLGD